MSSIYARIENGAVAEFPTVPAGFTPAQCFTPAIAAQCVDVTDVTPTPQVGDIATQTSGKWSFAPPAAPPGPTLAEAQATQTALVRAACKAAIEGGFTSSGSGAALTYPSDPTSQTNIGLAAAHGGQLWCATAAGVWGLAAHTAVQAAQVQADLTAHIQAQQATYATHLATIAAATTVAAVQAVSW